MRPIVQVLAPLQTMTLLGQHLCFARCLANLGNLGKNKYFKQVCIQSKCLSSVGNGQEWSNCAHNDRLIGFTKSFSSSASIFGQWQPPPANFNFAFDVVDAAAGETETADRRAFWHVANDGATTQWSYGHLSLLSKRAASALSSLAPTTSSGSDATRAVLVASAANPEWWLLNVAAARAGIVLLPGTSQLSGLDMMKRIYKSKSNLFIGDVTSASKLEGVLNSKKDKDTNLSSLKEKIVLGGSSTELDELLKRGWKSWNQMMEDNGETIFEGSRAGGDAIMQIFFTSGTTGEPKMVCRLDKLL